MNPELKNLESAEVVKEKHPVFQVTKTSKYLSIILFIIMPFIGGWIGYSYALEKVAEVEKKNSLTLENQKEHATTNTSYKKTFLGGEIPSDWKDGYITNEEREILEGIYGEGVEPVFSFADESISYTDWNGSQIDFLFLKDEDAKNLYMQRADWWGGEISNIEISDIKTILITYPLDNGEVTKAGTGGSAFILQIPEDQITSDTDPRYLVINKQALGDSDFEATFKNYLETANFSNILNSF